MMMSLLIINSNHNLNNNKSKVKYIYNLESVILSNDFIDAFSQ